MFFTYFLPFSYFPSSGFPFPFYWFLNIPLDAFFSQNFVFSGFIVFIPFRSLYYSNLFHFSFKILFILVASYLQCIFITSFCLFSSFASVCREHLTIFLFWSSSVLENNVRYISSSSVRLPMLTLLCNVASRSRLIAPVTSFH
jgi:hypothetical protein